MNPSSRRERPPFSASIEPLLRKALARAVWVASGLAMALGLSGCGVLLFPAPSRPTSTPEGAELVRSERGPAPSLSLYRPPAPGKAVVVFFHGNGADVSGSAWLADVLAQKGFGALLVEYPGYGSAPGVPSERAIYDAAESALGELYERGIERERIVLVGQSLGTAVAVEMSVRGHGSKMVLISPFTSIADLVDGMLPFGVAGLFVTDRFDTLSKARRVPIETVILEGDEDWLVPLEMAEEVAERIAGAELVVLAGSGHNDVFDRPDGAVLGHIERLAGLASALR